MCNFQSQNSQIYGDSAGISTAAFQRSPEFPENYVCLVHDNKIT